MDVRKRIRLRRFRRTARYLALAVAVVFFCTCHKARALKLFRPTLFGMEAIAPRTYVDKAMPSDQREQILKIVSDSEARVARYYGNVSTRPELFFYSSQDSFQSFGGASETGLTFLGRASLFSPRGRSVPIVAHEWSHVEFQSRVGLWHLLKVPRWFDEGLAVTVSEEPRHSESVYQEALQAGASPPSLAELETSRQWNQAVKKYRAPELNPGNRAVVYAAAGHEVREWFQRAGVRGLQEFCLELDSGTNFSLAYAKAGHK